MANGCTDICQKKLFAAVVGAVVSMMVASAIALCIYCVSAELLEVSKTGISEFDWAGKVEEKAIIW